VPMTTWHDADHLPRLQPLRHRAHHPLNMVCCARRQEMKQPGTMPTTSASCHSVSPTMGGPPCHSSPPHSRLYGESLSASRPIIVPGSAGTKIYTGISILISVLHGRTRGIVPGSGHEAMSRIGAEHGGAAMAVRPRARRHRCTAPAPPRPCPAASPPGVRPHCRLRNSGTEHASEAGMEVGGRAVQRGGAKRAPAVHPRVRVRPGDELAQ
jgi:hypothetical protein